MTDAQLQQCRFRADGGDLLDDLSVGNGWLRAELMTPDNEDPVYWVKVGTTVLTVHIAPDGAVSTLLYENVEGIDE